MRHVDGINVLIEIKFVIGFSVFPVFVELSFPPLSLPLALSSVVKVYIYIFVNAPNMYLSFNLLRFNNIRPLVTRFVN